MTQIGVLDARNSLSELIKRAKAGEDIVITSRNVAQIRLVPVEPSAKLGAGRSILDWVQAHPTKVGSVRSDSQIDEGILVEREAWE